MLGESMDLMPFIFVGIVVIVGGLAIFSAISEDKARSAPCAEVVSEGVYERVEYASEGGRYGDEFTVIHFEDGRTALLPGFRSVNLKKGTKVKVLTNGYRKELQAA